MRRILSNNLSKTECMLCGLQATLLLRPKQAGTLPQVLCFWGSMFGIPSLKVLSWCVGQGQGGGAIWIECLKFGLLPTWSLESFSILCLTCEVGPIHTWELWDSCLQGCSRAL